MENPYLIQFNKNPKKNAGKIVKLNGVDGKFEFNNNEPYISDPVLIIETTPHEKIYLPSELIDEVSLINSSKLSGSLVGIDIDIFMELFNLQWSKINNTYYIPLPFDNMINKNVLYLPATFNYKSANNYIRVKQNQNNPFIVSMNLQITIRNNNDKSTLFVQNYHQEDHYRGSKFTIKSPRFHTILFYFIKDNNVFTEQLFDSLQLESPYGTRPLNMTYNDVIFNSKRIVNKDGIYAITIANDLHDNIDFDDNFIFVLQNTNVVENVKLHIVTLTTITQ